MDVLSSLMTFFFFLTLFLSSPLTSQTLTPNCAAAVSGSTSTLRVFHVDSPCSPFRTKQTPSWEETVLKSQSNDHERLQYLVSLVAGKSFVPIASGRQQPVQSPTYVVKASVGTPPQSFLLAVDTSNDAAWIPCGGCVGCSSTVFTSELSTSYKTLGCQDSHCQQVTNPICSVTGSCSFNITYGGSTVAANLSQDTVNLAGDNITGYTFGCIQKVTGTSVPPQGLLGLGRGPLSLLSQSQNLYQSTFSYCLPSYKSLNFSGTLRLGLIAQPKTIKYTPLLKNPRRSSLYYVDLLAIKVGRNTVAIPPSSLSFNTTTGAGTIIDSGTVFTRLVQPAYEAVRDEFRRRMGTATVISLGGFDTCYTVPVTIPSITFLFAGLNVTLPQDNFLIHSSSGSTTCLAMAASPANVNSVLNVVASFQQQNHRYLFDIPNNRLGISREACS
ncbi:aspartyl protease AED3-like [Impatiens glandulifera]|uniref:aspartyl protease AED3-like n=1 Tax=Impatiens glandulifera TaxID=253017 RepID=UPI001FB0A818|nr:aspartyl protease AED3-like [Impatiens glandulifera]